MTWKDHRTQPSSCIDCGKKLDAAFAADPAHPDAPLPGSISICMYCHHLMIYGDDMTLRNPTDEEMTELAGDEELLQAMKLLKLKSL